MSSSSIQEKGCKVWELAGLSSKKNNLAGRFGK
jgi:hypothetical protein